MKTIDVVTIGGAGGQAKVLKALRAMPGLKITGICPSTDSGGSTGSLKEDYGAKGYLGDLTWCIAALCPDPILSRALLYRYGKGTLKGHSVKNVLFVALEKTAGTGKALEEFWSLCSLGIHRVLPVTEERTELCAALKIGNTVVSEANIDQLAKNPLWHPDAHAIKSVYLKPEARASKEAVKSIVEADWLIVTPGDFYSSIVPSLLPGGIKGAIARSKARIAIILNIVNKKGETQNYAADDFVSKIEGYVGRRADVILCNDKKIPPKALIDYALEDKVEFKKTKKNKADRRIRYAPFAEIAEDGTLAHDLDVLIGELKKVVRP
ncbi:MAG: 2-phospho-L-lactate transferase CofD family protein [Minisyncoccia bacterium]|jgi:uncharacterized cofD-like protein